MHEPVYAPGQAIGALEAAMREPQPPGQTLRAVGVKVNEQVTPGHSMMRRLETTAQEYGFSAHVDRYNANDRTTHVWVLNERD